MRLTSGQMSSLLASRPKSKILSVKLPDAASCENGQFIWCDNEIIYTNKIQIFENVWNFFKIGKIYTLFAQGLIILSLSWVLFLTEMNYVFELHLFE